MTKKSASRLAKDAAIRREPAQPRQPRIAPVQTLHPMFKQKLDEIRQEEVEQQAQIDTVPVWDELNDLYVNCAKGVMAPMVLSQLAKRRDLIVFIRDQKALQTRIGMFKRDIVQLKQELSEIFAEHRDRTGGASDPDELMYANTIAEKYALFGQRLEACIVPSVNHILEIFTEAELAQKAAQDATDGKLTPEQDPNVVTDVEATMSVASEAIQDINS